MCLYSKMIFLNYINSFCADVINDSNAVCDPSGIILIPYNCSSLCRLSCLSRLPYARFLTKSADVIKKTIDKLNSDLHFQECQLQSPFTTLYSLVGKQYPGQVLSALLCKPTAVITVSDVLTEISCAQTNVTLLQNLQHGNFFSSHSLVQIPSPNSTFRIGQIY